MWAAACLWGSPYQAKVSPVHPREVWKGTVSEVGLVSSCTSVEDKWVSRFRISGPVVAFCVLPPDLVSLWYPWGCTCPRFELNPFTPVVPCLGGSFRPQLVSHTIACFPLLVMAQHCRKGLWDPTTCASVCVRGAARLWL